MTDTDGKRLRVILESDTALKPEDVTEDVEAYLGKPASMMTDEDCVKVAEPLWRDFFGGLRTVCSRVRVVNGNGRTIALGNYVPLRVVAYHDGKFHDVTHLLDRGTDISGLTEEDLMKIASDYAGILASLPPWGRPEEISVGLVKGSLTGSPIRTATYVARADQIPGERKQ